MKALLFPALAPGEGEILNFKLTARQHAGLKKAAVRLRVCARDEEPSVAALIRALGAGELVVERRGEVGSRQSAVVSGESPAVHRGCPAD